MATAAIMDEPDTGFQARTDFGRHWFKLACEAEQLAGKRQMVEFARAVGKLNRDIIEFLNNEDVPLNVFAAARDDLVDLWVAVNAWLEKPDTPDVKWIWRFPRHLLD